MRDAILFAVRILTGGVLVAAFAIVADVVSPKMFAGLFSAAPAVATAGLLVTGLVIGPARDQMYARGMIAGAAGLVVYSVAAALLVRHLNAAVGSVLAWVAWMIPAGAVYWVFLR